MIHWQNQKYSSGQWRDVTLTAPLQVKLHPWFRGLDWASLARTKAAFIPTVEHEYDTSYFATKPVRLQPALRASHSPCSSCSGNASAVVTEVVHGRCLVTSKAPTTGLP